MTRKPALVPTPWEMAATRLVAEYVDGEPVERVEGTLMVATMEPFAAGEAAQAMAELAAWVGRRMGSAADRGGADRAGWGWPRSLWRKDDWR